MSRGDKKRILAVHLLSDDSDSSFAFRQTLEVLTAQSYKIHRLTSRSSDLVSQVALFIKVLLAARRKDIVYLHSILPYGAALAAKLRGCRVIYHIHDVSVEPPLFRRLLLGIVKSTARQCIFTSHYCREQAPPGINGKVIYNPLPLSFTSKVPQPAFLCPEPFTVLMICPLQSYKGLMPFVKCAAALPGLRFELVLDASRTDIDAFFTGLQLPPNLFLYETQGDPHPFYARASVVMNLSVPDQWIETFDGRVLEAMYYGKPVIVPPVGGVTELVEDGSEGFYVDSRRIEDLVTAICVLSENNGIYTRMSGAAFRKARCFGKVAFDRGMTEIFRVICL